MINIKLIQIGHNDLINLKNFVKNRNESTVFHFDTSILENLNADFLNKPELTIHNTELAKVLISDTADFNIGIINRPLDKNWFSQPINDKFIVISTFDFDTLELHEGISLSEQSVRFLVKKYAKIAGLERRITPHSFRHSFATLLLEQDVDIKYIQHLLGHSSIMTTQIYTHVNGEKQKQILQRHPRRNFSIKQKVPIS